jgi:hypothetical protein
MPMIELPGDSRMALIIARASRKTITR